mgnify:CR=1 FL=1
MGITNALQEQFVSSGVVPWNFQCAVYDHPTEFNLIGQGWIVPISTGENARSVACTRTTKNSGKRLYRDSRWTLMPNFDLCQFRQTGNTLFDQNVDFSPKSIFEFISKILADECGALMTKALKRACKCGTGVAIVAKRGAGIYTKNYSKQYRGRRWDIAAFCTGFGC